MTGQQPIEILSAALTPIIGIIAVYIAYQQYRTNALKLKHELYDRRLSVYRAIIKLLSVIVTRGTVSHVELLTFISETAESHFLFKEEISKYIEDIYDKG